MRPTFKDIIRNTTRPPLPEYHPRRLRIGFGEYGGDGELVLTTMRNPDGVGETILLHTADGGEYLLYGKTISRLHDFLQQVEETNNHHPHQPQSMTASDRKPRHP